MSSIDSFLNAATFAVAGASTDRSKYGNIVFRALLKSGREVFPLNPNATVVEGHVTFPAVGDLSVPPEALSIVTPPDVTRRVVADAIRAGVQHIWMQPGAEDDVASQSAREAGINVIDDGSCILVLLSRER